MAGGDMIRPEPVGGFKEAFPFHLTVADDAGIRRSSRLIFGHKTVHDLSPEDFRVIHGDMRYPEEIGDLLRIPGRGKVPAGMFAPGPHRDPDCVPAVLLQKKRSHRTVDTAGHADDDLSFFHAAASFFIQMQYGSKTGQLRIKSTAVLPIILSDAPCRTRRASFPD